ncbi:MAG: hypothetical protein ACOCZ6_02370 [Nanoarchaeota archaeon]
MDINYQFFGTFAKKYYKNTILLDIVLMVLTLGLLAIYKSAIVMLVAYFLVYPYLIQTKRERLLKPFIIASFVALAWVITSQQLYNYNIESLSIMGLDVFPFFAWATGLFALYLLYSYIENKIKPKTIGGKLAIFISIYWPLLIFVETIAYHFFNIKNIETVAYSGLPLCDCIHAPGWMQASYFILGIVFLVILLHFPKLQAQPES